MLQYKTTAASTNAETPESTTAPASTLRLVGGANDLEGRVEIYHNGNWGTVCDDDWDLTDGNVVCRMLGYGPASSAPSNAFFGEGTGEIVLDDISCDGTESDLSQCGHGGYLNHNCVHSEDAGVICLTGRTAYFNFHPCSHFPTIYFMEDYETHAASIFLFFRG